MFFFGLSVCLSVCLSACLFVYLYVRLSFCVSVYRSVYLPFCVRACVRVCVRVLESSHVAHLALKHAATIATNAATIATNDVLCVDVRVCVCCLHVSVGVMSHILLYNTCVAVCCSVLQQHSLCDKQRHMCRCTCVCA